jgi:ubiquitin carboxyl-terminal hydrolase 8
LIILAQDLNRIKKKPYIEDHDCDGTNDEKDAIEAWANYLRRNKSLVVDIFQGQLKSELQCLKCRHKNIRFEPFMYLSLPMPSNCRSLKDCLELYLAKEKLTGENQWYCAKCKKHRDATKKTDLWILPPILIVHLKRFKFNENGRAGYKNDAPISYRVDDWDLSQYVKSRGSEPPLFDLYAVSNHVGGLGSGHYTAYALNRFTEQWYEFNDSRRRAIDKRELHKNRSSAYVLFYNRCQPDKSEGSKEGRAPPLIRRQSVSRPDLWPHTQVQDRQFREFARKSGKSSRKLPPAPPFLPLGAGKGANGEAKRHHREE